MQESRPGRRVAIVAGVRTPFAKSGTVFRDVSAVALARHASRELLFRSEIDGREVDEVIFSQVVPSVLAPNVGREVSLLPQLLPSVPAYTLNRACASSAQAIANAADQISLGHADTILAGGVESLSDIPILHSRRFSRVLVDASKARSLGARVAAFGRARPRDLVPVTPAIAEPSTGETHGPVGGEDGEGERHQPRGAGPGRAPEPPAGRRGDRRRPARRPRSRRGSAARTWIRSLDCRQRHPRRHLARGARQAAAGVRPAVRLGHRGELLAAHRRRGGGAADGRGEGGARSDTSRSPISAATPWRRWIPAWQLLMGPVYAVPKALERAGHPLERHRTVRDPRGVRRAGALERAGVGIASLGRPAGPRRPVGEVDWERTNVMGGSIAIGHPFAATGARLVTTLANEMRRRDVQFGLISICAQGGMGFAMVLERDS